MLHEQISVIYARDSSINNSPVSIEDQIRICAESAKLKGWPIYKIYTDRAVSATSVAPREAFKAMLRDAMKPTPYFNRILVDSTSRIARNTRDALDAFSLLTFNNVHVFYVSQNIDTTQDGAEAIITVHGVVDSQFIQNLRRLTRRGLEGKVLKGYSAGGRRFGYCSEPVYKGRVDIYKNPVADAYMLRINPVEAETIVRIFRLYGEEGYSARAIARILNEELNETGAPTSPKGKWWSTTTLSGSSRVGRGILNNRLYVGEYRWNRTRTLINPITEKRKTILNERDKWIIVKLPSLRIVDDQLWEKVKKRQKQVAETSQGRYNRSRSPYSAHLLTGLKKCEECGANIVIVSGGRCPQYGCSANWNKGDSVCKNNRKTSKSEMEQQFIDNLAITFDPLFVKDLTKRVNDMITDIFEHETIPWEDKALTKELTRTDKEISNLLNAIGAGIITDSIKEKLLQTEKRKESIKQRLGEIDLQRKRIVVSLSEGQVRPYIENLLTTLRLFPALGRQFLSIVLARKNIENAPFTYPFLKKASFLNVV